MLYKIVYGQYLLFGLSRIGKFLLLLKLFEKIFFGFKIIQEIFKQFGFFQCDKKYVIRDVENYVKFLVFKIYFKLFFLFNNMLIWRLKKFSNN